MSDVSPGSEFQVQDVLVEVPIDAAPDRVWTCLTAEAGSWWPRDYYVDPEGGRFTIDARVGGLMFEDHGEGEGTIWATVTHVKKGESLRLSAEIWPEYGGPARSIQVYRLEARDGGTLLRFTDTMYGRVTAGTLASMTEGWSYLFGRAFKTWVETGKPPPASSPLSC